MSISMASYVQVPINVVTTNFSSNVSINGVVSASYLVGNGSLLTGIGGTGNAITNNYSGSITINGGVVISSAAGVMVDSVLRRYSERISASTVNVGQTLTINNGPVQRFSLATTALTFTLPPANAGGAGNGWNLTIEVVPTGNNMSLVWSGVDSWIVPDPGISSGAGNASVYEFYSDGNTRFGLPLRNVVNVLSVQGQLVAGRVNIIGTISAASFSGNLTGTVGTANNATTANTAANATNLNSQPASYYLDASNKNAGTIALAYLPSTTVSNNYRAGGISINGAVSANYLVGNGSLLTGMGAANSPLTPNYNGSLTINGWVTIPRVNGVSVDAILRRYSERIYNVTVNTGQTLTLNNGPIQQFSVGASGLTFTLPAANAAGTGIGWSLVAEVTPTGNNMSLTWSGVDVWLGENKGIANGAGNASVYEFYSDGATRYGVPLRAPTNVLIVPGIVLANLVSVNGTITAVSFAGNLTGTIGTANNATTANTAANATNLNAQPASYYLDASNKNAGIIGLVYMPSTNVTSNYRGGISVNAAVSASYLVGSATLLTGIIAANSPLTPNYTGSITINGSFVAAGTNGVMSDAILRGYKENAISSTVNVNQTISLNNGAMQRFSVGTIGLTFTLPAANAAGAGNGWNLSIAVTPTGNNMTLIWSGVDEWIAENKGLSLGAGNTSVYEFYSDGTTRFGLPLRAPTNVLTVPGTLSANRVSVNGTISAKSFRANGTTLNVPDYVFEKGYRLLSISELKDYVDLHKHLPSVPSAGDVQKTGLSLEKINLALLERIESMTLYIFQLEDRLKQLE